MGNFFKENPSDYTDYNAEILKEPAKNGGTRILPGICDINNDNSDSIDSIDTIGKIERIEILCDEYFHGELSAQEMLEFEEHVKECETCARVFESTRKYFSAIKQAEHTSKNDIAASVMEIIITERRTVGKPPRKRFIPFGLIGAAAIVLVLALGSHLDVFSDMNDMMDVMTEAERNYAGSTATNEYDAIYGRLEGRASDFGDFRVDDSEDSGFALNDFALATGIEATRIEMADIEIDIAFPSPSPAASPPVAEMSAPMTAGGWSEELDAPAVYEIEDIGMEIWSRDSISWDRQPMEWPEIIPSEIIIIRHNASDAVLFGGLPEYIQTIAHQGSRFITREYRDMLIAHLNSVGIYYEVEELPDVVSDYIRIIYIID